MGLRLFAAVGTFEFGASSVRSSDDRDAGRTAVSGAAEWNGCRTDGRTRVEDSDVGGTDDTATAVYYYAIGRYNMVAG